MRFEFATATRILFGVGVYAEAVPAAKALGSRFLLVTGRAPSRARSLRSALDTGHVLVDCSIPGEPTIDTIRDATQLARTERCDCVLAVGGGSVIDAGKAIAAMIANPGDVLDYLEVVGRGYPLLSPSVPFVAIPTTAGTGAEVTRNAVLGSAEHGVKASLRSPLMLPTLAVVDPDLTLDLPPALTAQTGMDALTQLIEPYVCRRANPMTDALCRDGIPRVAGALRVAFRSGGDRDARREMALASLYGGLALANAGLGAVHGFAAPIGGRFAAPHGAVCAAMLPHAMRVNIEAMRRRDPENAALARYADVSRLLTGRGDATAEDGIAWVEALRGDLAIPPLREWGVTEDSVDTISERAAAASSMKANPIELSAEERADLLRRSL